VKSLHGQLAQWEKALAEALADMSIAETAEASADSQSVHAPSALARIPSLFRDLREKFSTSQRRLFEAEKHSKQVELRLEARACECEALRCALKATEAWTDAAANTDIDAKTPPRVRCCRPGSRSPGAEVEEVTEDGPLLLSLWTASPDPSEVWSPFGRGGGLHGGASLLGPPADPLERAMEELQRAKTAVVRRNA